MILVIGSGFLGSYILKRLEEDSDNQPIIGTYINENKIADLSQVKFIHCDLLNNSDIQSLSERCRGEELIVFYFAALHNIDYVFENRQEAERTNIDALKNFYNIMPPIKKLFFSSTDCVYGESADDKNHFYEEDKLTPINIYGQQKVEAEKIVLSHNHTVVRLPFMIGPSLSKQKNFYDNLCDDLFNNKTIEMIDGMYRCALTYYQVADYLIRLSKLSEITLPNIINICSDELYSKYDIGCIIADKLKISNNYIKKITEDKGKKFFKDKRASSISMSNLRLKKLLNIKKIELDL